MKRYRHQFFQPFLFYFVFSEIFEHLFSKKAGIFQPVFCADDQLYLKNFSRLTKNQRSSAFIITSRTLSA